MAALLDRLKKTQKKTDSSSATTAVGQVPVTAKKDTKKTAEKKGEAVLSVTTVAKSQAFTLLRPHVSEKAASAADKGIYVFDVPVSTNKLEIAKAVESLYKVNVIKVRTIRGIGKSVRRGLIRGRRNRWKKALVELQKGQTINLVEGV